MHLLKRQPLTLLTFLLPVLCVANTFVAAPIDNSKMTVFRCVDSKGKVSLQDVPCANSSKQETLNMMRPKDAPPLKTEASKPVQVVIPKAPVQTQAQTTIPPALYQCTDFDGKVRNAEYDDPRPRCVPLWVLGYQTSSNACQWVEDTCELYPDNQLCDEWKEKIKQTELDITHSFTSNSVSLQKDLERYQQIVRTSCR